ncbi:mRNA cap guanine-N7 methyltransferase [Giardia duodenalis]|uniref:mRNA (guanine-N(7))-methyltransferase n=2 Tax=Giardia intestinalis TaxID=5741 RepID=A8BJ69_GIAIC|nr:mRNA cap guanine-N7 methyltransferase [Giardia intestinalis]ESU39605.1 MRNA (guanine-N(7)-)-methyltransferase [Giardia intestinalis]KAE8304868.1 mRNA cap guanine-N7 methyltransferase [Giardia intestinalis]|eukprot:XP_001706752.1 Hypothetical protein GL50803_22338 [Giardia lamblia ATCC 50803]
MNATATMIYNKYAQQCAAAFGKARQISKIIPIRDFNNWAKSVLIKQYLVRGSGRKDLSVMDMCSGRGGDLKKFSALGRVRYLACVDVSLESIVEAIMRYNAMVSGPNNRGLYLADFVWADVFETALSKHFIPHKKGLRFDMISCQFALHYAFESEARARILFQNIRDCLSNEGSFIAIFASKEIILSRLEAAGYSWPSAAIPPSIGNGLYSVRFTEPFRADPHNPNYGVKYYFELEEAIDNIPEYFVDFENIRTLCKEFGLTIKKHFATLSDFYNEYFNLHPEPSETEFFKRMLKNTGKYLTQEIQRGENLENSCSDFFDDASEEEQPAQLAEGTVVTEVVDVKALTDLPAKYLEVINIYQAVVIGHAQPSSFIEPYTCRSAPVCRRLADVINLTPNNISREQLRESFSNHFWTPGTGLVKQ